jgi:hypothetical protein
MGRRKLQQRRRSHKAAVTAARLAAQHDVEMRRYYNARQFEMSEVAEPEFAFRMQEPPSGIDRPQSMMTSIEAEDYDMPGEARRERSVPDLESKRAVEQTEQTVAHSATTTTTTEIQQQRVECNKENAGPTKDTEPSRASSEVMQTPSAHVCNTKKSAKQKAIEWTNKKFEISDTPTNELAKSMYLYIVETREKEFEKCQIRNDKAKMNRTKARYEATSEAT